MRAAALMLALGLAGCARGGADGPVEVKFDRDVCKACGMVISDRRFVAEVKGAQQPAAKFDDVGCAMKWLEAQPFANDAATRIWVAENAEGNWADGRTARYTAGAHTPMGYGYSAGATGPLDFTAMREALRANAGPRGSTDQEAHR